jgi:hypothetical protein
VSSFVDTVIYFSNKPFLWCMEHAIHVSVGHFIQVVSPPSVCVLVMKIKKAFCDAQLDDDNIDFDALEADPGVDIDDTNNADANDKNEDADDEAADFTFGDTIGKSLALVKQVSKSNICE